ncbi:MAG: DASS family sodium-coupled anion symporter [Deltaproteobacteria bacterium]|nr:DASS family sodium-coupled anion symporter [Deltaproteobacteria bacterium]
MSQELLSPAEERFERIRKTTGFFLGPLLFLTLLLIPIPALAPAAHQLLAVQGWVVIFWVTEAIPLPATALLGALLAVFLGVAPPKEVLAPFADPIVFLFLGSFILAEAIMIHGLHKRFALAILSKRFAGRGPSRVLLACGLITAVISMWISNSATTAMMLPVALGVLDAMSEVKSPGRRFASGIMLMIAYGASVGGIGTPVGSPPNLIGIGFIQSLAGVKITFFEWMLLTIPLLVVMYGVLFLILKILHPSQETDFKNLPDLARAAQSQHGGWNRGERNAFIAFCVAVLFWILPSLLALIYGKEHAFVHLVSSRLDESVVAVFAALLLFILPINWRERQFTIGWSQAVRIDWGTLILFGGGLTLGKLMFSTGLAEFIGSQLTEVTGVKSLWGVTGVAIALSILVSEATSNTASASMIIPVMIALAKSAGISPVPPALGACLGASFGFMLPVSTPPNAIVYGSGRVPITAMIRVGVIFDIVGFFIIWGGLWVLCPIFGWS